MAFISPYKGLKIREQLENPPQPRGAVEEQKERKPISPVGNYLSFWKGEIAPQIKKVVKNFNDKEVENKLKYGRVMGARKKPKDDDYPSLLEKFKDPNTSEEEKVKIRKRVIQDDIENSPALKALNSEEAEGVMKFIGEHSSNLGLKTKARRDAILSFGKKNYEEELNKLLKDRNDPNNNYLEKVAYGMQDSGIQSGIGVLLNFVPVAGKALSTAFWTAISAESQRQEKGRVESVKDIGIDVIGDRVLSGVADSVLKQGGKGAWNATKNVAKGGVTEGMTEVSQEIAKLSRAYSEAPSDKERDAIRDELVDYVKEGRMAEEFGVGFGSGGMISGGAHALGANSGLSSEQEQKLGQLENESITRSQKEYQDAQAEGLAQMQVDGKLNPKIVEGRTNDIAQKLDMQFEKGKGAEFKKALKGKEFANYNEFARRADGSLKEVLTESQYNKVDPQIVQESPKKDSKEFNDVYNALPQKAKSAALKAIDTRLTMDDVEFFSDEEATLLGTVLNYAKDVEGANTDVINENLNTLKESGIEIPGVDTQETPATPAIEKPEPLKGVKEQIAEKTEPATKEDVKSTVQQAVDKPAPIKEVETKPVEKPVESLETEAVKQEAQQEQQPAKIPDTLIQEARKYDSAEEFVEDNKNFYGLNRDNKIIKNIIDGKNKRVTHLGKEIEVSTLPEKVNEAGKLRDIVNDENLLKRLSDKIKNTKVVVLNDPDISTGDMGRFLPAGTSKQFPFRGKFDEQIKLGDKYTEEPLIMLNANAFKGGDKDLYSTIAHEAIHGERVIRGRKLDDVAEDSADKFEDFLNKQRQSQQTDIWNKANKEVKAKPKTTQKKQPIQKAKKVGKTIKSKPKYQKKTSAKKAKVLSNKEVLEQIKRIPFLKGLTVRQVNKILTPEGKEAWGSYQDALIKFVENPKETTLPHEAGHAFIDMVYTDKQKQELYNEVRKYKKDKTLSDFKAEEIAVELMAKRFTINKTPKSKLAKMIDWLARKLKQLVQGADQIELLLQNVVSKKGAKLVSASKKFQQFKAKEVFDEKETINGKGVIRSGDEISENFTTMYENMVARERFNIPELEKINFGGSDRDVYDLGNGMVLKVSKSARGKAQNALEGEPYAPVPEVIERGQNYVVTEKAEKPNAKTKELVKRLKHNRDYDSETPATDMINWTAEEYFKKGDEETGSLIQDLNNYNIMPGDITAIRNWGTIDGEPVLVDAGSLDIQMLKAYEGRTNLSDADFRKDYQQSKQAKKRFKDTDSKTMYQEMTKSEQFQAAVADVVSELEAAKAGKRSVIKDSEGYATGVLAEGSTFPKWVPEKLRSRELFDKVIDKFMTEDFDNIVAPAGTRQRELFDVIVEEIESRTVVDIGVVEPKRELVTKKGRLSTAETFNDVWTSIYGFPPDQTMTNLMEKNSAEIAKLMAQKGFSAGKKRAWTKAKGRLRAKLWQQKKEFSRKKDFLIKKNKNKEITKKNLRRAVKQLMKELPIEVRRRILAQERMFDIRGGKHLANILDSIEKAKREEVARQERVNMQSKVIARIKAKRLKKTENLQKAWEFPPIKKMNMEQLAKFDKALREAEINDVFLTQRQLETIKNTELDGIKTMREGRQKLAERLGVAVDQLQNIIIKNFEHYKFDALLAEQHPFYRALVEDVYAETLQAEERTLAAEKNINRLMRAARKSRERTILDRLIPTDNLVFDYLESDNKVEIAKKMTPEELAAAEYISQEFEAMRDYLIANQMLDSFMSNYITHIRRGFLETYKNDGFVKAFKGVFEQQRENEETFKIVSETGEILPLEKFFQFAMKRSGEMTPSKNVARAFMTYKQTFETKRALDAIMPMFDVYVSALSPQETTERGKAKNDSLKKFYNEWMNNKKGRRTTVLKIAQGSKIDIFLRGLKSFTTMLDLGGALPIGVASLAGEEVVTAVSLGPVKMARGSARMATKKGKQIIKDNRAFVGKEVVEDLTEASDNAADKAKKGLFVMFRIGNVLANKQFLLGSLTQAEFESGKVSPQRLAEIKRKMGRWRVVEGSNSIMGATSVGKIMTQYKTWAIPPLATSASNLKYVIKNLKKGSLKSEQAAELYRAAVITAVISLLISAAVQSDDEDDSFFDKIDKATTVKAGDSFLVRVQKKAIRESLTIMQVFDSSHFFGQPRSIGLLDNLWEGISMTARLEKYEQTRKGKYKKGQLKGPRVLYRTLTPGGIRQLNIEKKKKKDSGYFK